MSTQRADVCTATARGYSYNTARESGCAPAGRPACHPRSARQRGTDRQTTCRPGANVVSRLAALFYAPVLQFLRSPPWRSARCAACAAAACCGGGCSRCGGSRPVRLAAAASLTPAPCPEQAHVEGQGRQGRQAEGVRARAGAQWDSAGRRASCGGGEGCREPLPRRRAVQAAPRRPAPSGATALPRARAGLDQARAGPKSLRRAAGPPPRLAGLSLTLARAAWTPSRGRTGTT